MSIPLKSYSRFFTVSKIFTSTLNKRHVIKCRGNAHILAIRSQRWLRRGLSRKTAGSTRQIWLHIKIPVHSNHCYVLTALPKNKKKNLEGSPRLAPSPGSSPLGTVLLHLLTPQALISRHLFWLTKAHMYQINNKVL